MNAFEAIIQPYFVQSAEGESPIGFVMFGDLMSQLLCFFILLFVIASANTSKATGEGIDSIVVDFSKNLKNVMQGQQKTKTMENIKAPAKNLDKDSPKVQILNQVKKMLISEKMSDYIEIIVEDYCIRILLPQPILFEPGKVTLKKEFVDFLLPITDVLKSIPNQIIIEGHTDNTPMHSSEFDSNWTLSYFRAYNVLKYFVQEKGLAPERFSTIGCGEYKPLVPNDTDENKAKNRRIEIVIITDSTALH